LYKKPWKWKERSLVVLVVRTLRQAKCLRLKAFHLTIGCLVWRLITGT
jgi:hypothetical protein